jgi:hypothetical protein
MLARRSELSRRPPGLAWISLTEAAIRPRLSRSGFLGLAQREGIAITERYGRRGVASAELNGYLERCRIAPGSYSPGSVPYKGRRGPGQVRHLDLLDEVAGLLSWDDADLARRVGVDIDSVGRWRSTGVPNGYLPALRALRDIARNGRLDGLDLAPLLPWGSRCRLEQVRKAARSARSLHGVAVMDHGERPIRLVGRETRRRSGRRSL